MDTTHLEYTAEDLIAHKLQRYGLLVAKPKFDRDGADLIALISVADGAKFCRIQCKGRSLKTCNNSNVKVPADYITDAFFVFLYIDICDNNTHIFCFSADDIKTNWNLKTEKDKAKEYYVLNIYKNSFLDSSNSSNLLEFSFTSAKIESIKKVIKKSNSKKEIKLFELIKTQEELRNKTKRYNELKGLLTEIKHLKEMEKLQGRNLNILERQYEDKLPEFGKELPEKLLQKINKLVKEDISATDIIDKVKETITSEIPETILKDYISKVLIQQTEI